jgi:ABC-type Fe3+-hydroxamate transport system substrate-binding protein
LNQKSREEARAYFQNYQDRVRETRDQMDSSKAIFDQNAGKEVRQYNPGDYFDVDA